MGEILGVLAAMLSSGIGGTAIGATRYLAGSIDPLALGAFRFGIGFVLLLPLAMLQGARWPGPQDWPGVAGLGMLFFGLFPVLFNASLVFTTAARGALALSTLPLLTMAAAALLGVEKLTARKSMGVLAAMLGVALALWSGLAHAPPGAWRGDLLMIGAAACMALYNVWSRPFITRSGPIPYTTLGMGIGALSLTFLSWPRGGFEPIVALAASHWLAIGYLGIFGGAVTFFLWAFALARTTPTRVAIAVTVNPVTAAVFGAVLLEEPLHWNLGIGIAAVMAGIWIATTPARPARRHA